MAQSDCSQAPHGQTPCGLPAGRRSRAIAALEDLETSALMARDLNALGRGERVADRNRRALEQDRGGIRP